MGGYTSTSTSLILSMKSVTSKTAHFRVTEVSPATWSIRAVSLDEMPGGHDDGGQVVRVVNLPENLPARQITDRLARVPNPNALPVIVDWSDGSW